MPEPDRAAPIGVFDSGLGGLSVVRAIRASLPNEAIHYLADTVHCPYGARPADEIRALSVGISRYLLDHACKLIVVACNTASGAALAYLRKTFPGVLFVGMVPAVKVATGLTRTGVVGVLATPNTLHGELYHDLVEHLDGGTRLIAHSSPDLVDLVEAGEIAGPEAERHLRAATRGMLAARADVIVLGCTHYPFLMPALERVVGPNVQLIEPSEAIARRTEYLLVVADLRREWPPQEPLVCDVTGDAGVFGERLVQLLGVTAPVQSVVWRGEHLVPAGRP